jgi:hypothetical protein
MEDAIIRRDFEGALLDLKRYEKTFMQLYQLVTEQKNFIDSKGN